MLKKNQKRSVIFLGLLSALFFSVVFPINYWLTIGEKGHWYWTASLRYIYVFILLSLLILIRKGIKEYIEVWSCYLSYFYFWLLAGGIGFGGFYLFLCYAANFSTGWILATTWQVTILLTPLVIWLLNKNGKVPLKGVLYLMLMFCGILLVNLKDDFLLNIHAVYIILPTVAAAICYPFGNTLCKYACEGKYQFIPINRFSISKDVFCQVLLMTMGALPIFFIVGVIISPPILMYSQIWGSGIVAVFVGIIATSFLYKARQLAGNNSFLLAAADGTQAAESLLALFWEYMIFGAALPSLFGWLGLAFVTIGILLFYFVDTLE